MKLKFSSDLQYQQDAIAAVCDVFEGQTTKASEFTIMNQVSMGQDLFAPQGIANGSYLDDEDILANIRRVQLRNGLPQSNTLAAQDMGRGEWMFPLDIEMETGTGKTYVYLRTILELNKRYGFTKFIIVVPSIAIKEGVKKTLDITKEHFRSLYDNVPYDYFIYDGKHVSKIRDFATSSNIQIMVINIAAFQRDENLINRFNDKKFGEEKPIEMLQRTRPIVIVDEPQSVIGTENGERAVASFHPLCTIRYSATPLKVQNKIYRLNAVDAFQQKLVKGIEVASFAVENAHNEAYMLLKKVSSKNGSITASIEMDVQDKKGVVSRKTKTVRQGSDLYEMSGNRDVYEGYIVSDISAEPDHEYVDFTSRSDILYLGKALGSVEEETMQKHQIRATIEEHLNKELRLNPLGIKVLSLFFIDRVANYRVYDADGNAQKGKFAQWFEEIYREYMKKPKYRSLFHEIEGEDDEAEAVHDGYFSIDKGKKGKPDRWKDSTGEGTTAADDSTYDLIMKDKEKLLSFDCPVRFIFSHSALKEGWDNPNVFQICTLNETRSDRKRRQEIGRGLRLCVNQQGERQYDTSLNVLTVMANESYDEFAAGLQSEYKADGVRFGVLEISSFACIVKPKAEGDSKPSTVEGEEAEYIGAEKAQAIVEDMTARGYIDKKGNVTTALKDALRENKLTVAEEFVPYASQIEKVCRAACGSIPIRNANKREAAVLNKAVYLSDDFRELWERIKWKTTYHISLNTDALLDACRRRIAQMESVKKAKIYKKKAVIDIDEGGVEVSKVSEEREVGSYGSASRLPDIVTYLVNETNLTRRTVISLLTGEKQNDSGEWVPFDEYGNRLEDFKRNPQAFMEMVAKIVHEEMRKRIVDGIRYTKIGDDAYYRQELFQNEELQGYLESNMVKAEKSVYEYVVYDSENEKKFAKAFEDNDDVRLYAKLPGWFKIPTPLGSYNPDWAVLFEKNGEQKLYFVVETKGSLDFGELRPNESNKIRCGEAHFKALGKDAEFKRADDPEKFIMSI